jgi:hypothetical protein
MLIKIGLASEIKCDALFRRKGKSLCKMLIVLNAVPLACTGYGLVPVVIGKAYMLKSKPFCVFKNSLWRLLGNT